MEFVVVLCNMVDGWECDMGGGQQCVGVGCFVEQCEMYVDCCVWIVFEVVLLVGVVEVYFENCVVCECQFFFV